MKTLYLFLFFGAVLTNCVLGFYTIYNENVVIRAGDFFFPRKERVHKYWRGHFRIRMDTVSGVCFICIKEEVKSCIRTPYWTYCHEETKQNTLANDNKALTSFWNNDEGSYELGFQCANEKLHCDVRLVIEVEYYQLPTPKPTKKPTVAPTMAPTQTPTREPTKNPSKSPTQRPTQRPTKGPRELPDALQCKSGTRHRTFIPEGSWSICGCDPKRVDRVCYLCCECSTGGNCNASQYDDLTSLPIFFGRWRLASSGQGGEGNVLTATTKRGLQVSSGVHRNSELSEFLTDTFGTNQPIGFSGSSYPPWMISVSQDFEFMRMSSFSTSAPVSQNLGSTAFQYTGQYEEHACSQSCQNKNGPIKIWQWYITDYEDRFIIHQCQFRCSAENEPRCPPDQCQIDDPDCQCCKAGTFRNSRVDVLASSVNYTSMNVDPYFAEDPSTKANEDFPLLYVILIAAGGSIFLVVALLNIFRSEGRPTRQDVIVSSAHP